ncbi:hypothetical protein NECAME_05532 [Necator americanus]|uniref:Uncharacterized protein n=1 Tax=Necator americanus TaxID=51031 RepID=W2SG94_NECAM|nr:hypothetical protein NECAME_05532 [Necator americanus]ETN68568.1 hypothetical protein NECAME_05532 [Necator americanus]
MKLLSLPQSDEQLPIEQKNVFDRYSSAERLPERWLKAVEESAIEDCVKMTREKLAKMFTEYMICDKRSAQEKPAQPDSQKLTNEQRQYRVVGSSLLKKLFKENGIANKLPFRQPITTPEKVASPPSPVVAPSEKTSSCLGVKQKNDTGVHSNGFPLYRTGFSGQECSVDELRAHAHESSLSDSLNFLKIIREKDDELLVTALSYAELSYKVTIRVLSSTVTDLRIIPYVSMATTEPKMVTSVVTIHAILRAGSCRKRPYNRKCELVKTTKIGGAILVTRFAAC